MSRSRIFDGMTEHHNTHLQQPMDCINSTSSSDQILGNHPAIKLLLVRLDHGGLKHPTMTHTPMDETKEDKTSEVDLIDPEQEEESTVVIPSLPTVQEISRYVYDSPYDGLVPNPDTGILMELRHSMASQFLVSHCKLPTMFCMLFGYPNFHNILDQSPFCNAKQQLKSKWMVVNEKIKTEIHWRSYFLLKEIQHDDNHPLKNGLASRFPKHANGKRMTCLNFCKPKLAIQKINPWIHCLSNGG